MESPMVLGDAGVFQPLLGGRPCDDSEKVYD